MIWELLHTVDVKETIITHDAGSPRDQLSPFWVSEVPLSYIGWGKTTQLGYGLGLAMGAKLAKPEKLCINVWGDAAIGFTGMDFETAVRERIPILSILMNNFSMAIELKVMPVATEKYRSTDISGHYANFAQALGRLWRAGHRARADRAGDPPRHREDPRGNAGIARIHHRAVDVSRFLSSAHSPRERGGVRRTVSRSFLACGGGQGGGKSKRAKVYDASGLLRGRPGQFPYHPLNDGFGR